MSETRNLVRIFIASPSDVQKERGIADTVVNELNTTIGDTYNIRLETKKWENNTYPAIGEYPQDVINEQIGDYDIFVGIMKHKFGSPTLTTKMTAHVRISCYSLTKSLFLKIQISSNSRKF